MIDSASKVLILRLIYAMDSCGEPKDQALKELQDKPDDQVVQYLFSKLKACDFVKGIPAIFPVDLNSMQSLRDYIDYVIAYRTNVPKSAKPPEKDNQDSLAKLKEDFKLTENEWKVLEPLLHNSDISKLPPWFEYLKTQKDQDLNAIAGALVDSNCVNDRLEDYWIGGLTPAKLVGLGIFYMVGSRSDTELFSRIEDQLKKDLSPLALCLYLILLKPHINLSNAQYKKEPLQGILSLHTELQNHEKTLKAKRPVETKLLDEYKPSDSEKGYFHWLQTIGARIVEDRNGGYTSLYLFETKTQADAFAALFPKRPDIIKENFYSKLESKAYYQCSISLEQREYLVNLYKEKHGNNVNKESHLTAVDIALGKLEKYNKASERKIKNQQTGSRQHTPQSEDRVGTLSELLRNKQKAGAEEEARRKAEEEARRKAEEEARRKAEEEARRKAEEEARQKVEEEARRKAEEEARRKAEEEARRKAEEEARRKAEEEARRKAEEEARQKAEEEARQKAEEARFNANLRVFYTGVSYTALSYGVLSYASPTLLTASVCHLPLVGLSFNPVILGISIAIGVVAAAAIHHYTSPAQPTVGS